MKKLITIVVPVFNEAENVLPFYEATIAETEKPGDRYDFEYVFTDNHSTDNTFDLLAEPAHKDRRIRVLRFSRNFGFQRSIWTGYYHARGDAAIEMDCDLQDPPALILDFIRLWESGYHVVYGVRRSRKEAWWINATRKFFYRLIDFLSEDELPKDAGDFRLVDRQVLNELRKIDDQQPYLRGSIAALRFTQIGVPYARSERLRGQSKFMWSSLMCLAIDGILNHSIMPLRIATFVELGIACLTFLGIIGFMIGKMFFGQNWPPGFAMMTTLILASLSLNALFLGIIGEYLGQLYQQVKKRPITVIEREITSSSSEPSGCDRTGGLSSGAAPA